MKNLFFVLLPALFIQINLLATNPDTLDFTIVAPSGLSLRTAPYLSSERLEVLPYGTSVKTVGHWDEIYNDERIDIVDARVGYWIETEYSGQKGYLFSGYLKSGPLYVLPTEINNDFRITVPGERCQAINYDPDLYWYGLYIDPKTGETTIKPTGIEIEQTKLSPEDKEMAYADYGDFINVKTVEKDSFLLLFGTREQFDHYNIAFEKSYFENFEIEHWDTQGKFIFPRERVKVYQDGYDSYYLIGHENIIFNSDPQAFEDSISRRYDIYLTEAPVNISMSDDKTISLAKAIGTENMHEYEYATYLGPRLVWQGDINNDGFPDMIFYTPYMTDCCGGSEKYQLLISKWKDGKWILEKVAEDEVFSCYGC